MAMWGSQISRQQLQHTISCLYTLDEVPEMAKENRIVSKPDSPHHHLTISRETEIASNLAFLSATSDDSLKVMAVCVEEHSNSAGMIIRIASNTGDLSVIANEFNKIARILEQAARRGNSKVDDQNILLRQVIAMDFYRILSRLRSCHAKKSHKTAGKPLLITQLNSTLHDKSIKATSQFSDAQFKALKDGARDLEVLSIELESLLDVKAETMKAQVVIGEILKKAYEYTTPGNLISALQIFSGDPTLKRHLPEALGKLGRYYSATCELVCAARDRNSKIFQNIEVETFQIQVPASISKKGWKVHAEIQLLFYYELYPDRAQPRIICSNKSACYLCNLFFQIHGSFQIPRTHGRLYAKWILPDWINIPRERHSDLRIIVSRFQAALDEKIRKGAKSKKSRYIHPNESVLLPISHWTSSNPSKNSSPTSSNPVSTIQPIELGSFPTNAENATLKLSLGLETPITPPRNPSEHNSRTGSVSNSVENLATLQPDDLADKGKKDSSDSVVNSVVTITKKDLPYDQAIQLATPSLHVRLDELFIVLDFVQVLSGRLLIAQAENPAKGNEANAIVDIQEIPTTTELKLNCSNDSNELVVRLQNKEHGVICISFIWNRAVTSAMA